MQSHQHDQAGGPWGFRRSTPLQALLALLALLVLGACSSASSSSRYAEGAATHAPSLTQPGAPEDVRACLDPTLSSAAGFAPTVRRAIANRVAAWAPVADAKPPDDTALTVPASAPRAGLRLTLFQVATNADSDAAPRLDLTVPGVPGLSAAPELEDENYGVDGPAWQVLATRRAADAAAAAKAQRSAADRIRSWPLGTRADSGIRDCLVTAGRSAQDGTRILLASDLMDNASQVAPAADALRGTEVVVLQSCPAGTETGCDRRVADLESWISAHGGHLTGRFRSGDLNDALTRWLEGPR